VKVGGLASAAHREGEQVLFHGDRVWREGAVGVALMGNVEVVPAVAQGCRGVGAPMRITACEGHLLTGLDGIPVLDALQRTFQDASERDRRLAGQALFLGFEMDPLEATREGPWLIRNLLGVDQETNGLYVGEPLRPGRRVRFHVRDRDASHEDLDRILAAAGADPAAALLFSCLGRGRHLYGEPDHDSALFDRHFSGTPLGGFFCSGEIGPVGAGTHLHGYTSSFGLIRPRDDDA
jgi:small ligand-binding sensory domain FIST